MDQQHDKFGLEPDVTYLNCAYMAPSLRASSEAARHQVERMANPWQVVKDDYFRPAEALRDEFAQLIGSPDRDRIALTPSASYGFANAARQVRPSRGSRVVLVGEQFPSNVYVWKRLARDFECEVVFAGPPEDGPNRGVRWNELLLEAITPNTAVVALPPLHWSDGTLFDLKAVRDKSSQCGAVMVIDGSQFVGASPLDVSELKPDALISAAYKWMLGPYGTGLAWYGDFFDDGEPMEENWIVHDGAEDFRNLVNYNDTLVPRGFRYSSGQHPALVPVAMLTASLRQINAWTPAAIKSYCERITADLPAQLDGTGFHLAPAHERSSHLFGIGVPEGVDLDQLKVELEKERIYVSLRGSSLRVSPYLYNSADDLTVLVNCLKKTLS